MMQEIQRFFEVVGFHSTLREVRIVALDAATCHTFMDVLGASVGPRPLQQWTARELGWWLVTSRPLPPAEALLEIVTRGVDGAAAVRFKAADWRSLGIRNDQIVDKIVHDIAVLTAGAGLPPKVVVPHSSGGRPRPQQPQRLEPCKFYAQGSCRYGTECRFSHE